MSVDEEIAILMQATQKAKEHGPRVGRAYARAMINGGFSANEALTREIKRATEEDEFLLRSAVEILNS